MKPRTCVSPSGKFIYGIHKPRFSADNLRENDFIMKLGRFADGRAHENHANFPPGDVEELRADTIYEIPNPFAFRGTTYIAKSWAGEKAGRPERIGLAEPSGCSFSTVLEKWFGPDELTPEKKRQLLESLPEAMLIALASNGNDPRDLVTLANICCEFVFDSDGVTPVGLVYENIRGTARPAIKNKDLFETLANNCHLPEPFKKAMVLNPGAQGGSEITGEFSKDGGHVFEYLRRNSYIPWGHYAANMAHDSERYRIADLTMEDMAGMRHLYYQRTFVRIARQLGLPSPRKRQRLSMERLEFLREEIRERLSQNDAKKTGPFNSTLWGWNFGFDFSPSGYRLHASHQQIHQQYALIPASVDSQIPGKTIRSFACGDMVAEFIAEYREETGKNFFDCYIQALRNNRRIDDAAAEESLVVHEDANVMLFVPKAQTSQWEIQLMTLPQVGNILEANTEVRNSLDKAMLIAMKVLWKMGARMVTTIEYAKRIDSRDADQRLVYAFLPKIPQSPGAFSEAQLRWINGHFPEDFASACRMRIDEASPRWIQEKSGDR